MQPYSDGVVAAGGLDCSVGCDEGCAYHIVEGSLPPGMSISTDGLLSGRPAAEGYYEAKVTMECSGSERDSHWLRFRVDPAPFDPWPWIVAALLAAALLIFWMRRKP
jgi:hypothetical protein